MSPSVAIIGGGFSGALLAIRLAAGGGHVRLIERNRRAGRSTEFWELDLPRITQEYVPRILALSRMIASPERFGLNLRETGEIAIFPGLTFRMAWNTGVNFGILSGNGDLTRWLLAGFSLIISGVLIIYSLGIAMIACTFWFVKFDNSVTILQALMDSGRYPAQVYPI